MYTHTNSFFFKHLKLPLDGPQTGLGIEGQLFRQTLPHESVGPLQFLGTKLKNQKQKEEERSTMYERAPWSSAGPRFRSIALTST